MNTQTIKHLQYFIGKVCSIISTSMNRSFDEKISREHFVVRVSKVDADGVWGVHPYNSELISFFALPHIISIHQEIELDPNNPEHKEMIEEYQNRTGKELKPDLIPVKTSEPKDLLPVIDNKKSPTEQNSVGDATFVDIANLEALAAQSKKTFDAEDYMNKR